MFASPTDGVYESVYILFLTKFLQVEVAKTELIGGSGVSSLEEVLELELDVLELLEEVELGFEELEELLDELELEELEEVLLEDELLLEELLEELEELLELEELEELLEEELLEELLLLEEELLVLEEVLLEDVLEDVVLLVEELVYEVELEVDVSEDVVLLVDVVDSLDSPLEVVDSSLLVDSLFESDDGSLVWEYGSLLPPITGIKNSHELNASIEVKANPNSNNFFFIT